MRRHALQQYHGMLGAQNQRALQQPHRTNRQQNNEAQRILLGRRAATRKKRRLAVRAVVDAAVVSAEKARGRWLLDKSLID